MGIVRESSIARGQVRDAGKLDPDRVFLELE